MYLDRIKKVRARMAKEGVDLLLLGPSSDIFYLAGYGIKGDKRLLLLVLPLAGEAFILANLLYREQVQAIPAAPLLDAFIFWKDGEDPFSLLKTEIEKRNIPVKKAALEISMPALFTLPLRNCFPGTDFVLASSLTDPLRQYKDPNELELIRRACRESDRALAAVIDKTGESGSYWIGKTEAEFYEALSAEFSRAGLSHFGAGIAVGANAAVPHHVPGRSVIEEGKCLLVDFWGRFEGYHTDCTRTFHFGRAEKEFEKIHDIVLEAQEAAQRAAIIGNTLADVDFAARSVIEKAGYGENFTHRTGHGCGIDPHEGDSVNAGVNVPLAPGMVFSIEPGIYLPGRFGVRIENLVAMGEQAAEILHTYPRELKVLS